MNFIYLDKSGNQVGPVDESIVIQGILSGELDAETPIRNALLRGYRTIGEFDCFAETLAQTTPVVKEQTMDDLSAMEFLRQTARNKVQEEQNRVIAAKLIPADAGVIRRLLALSLDALVLFILLLALFIPTIMSLKYRGEQDEMEINRQRKAREIETLIEQAELEKMRRYVVPPAPEQQPKTASHDEEHQAEQADHPSQDTTTPATHSVNRAFINKILPGTLKKVDDAYAKHNNELEKASGSSPQKQDRSKRKSTVLAKPADAPSAAAPQQPQRLAKKNKKRAAYKSIHRNARPQVLFVNLPGGEIFARFFPTAAAELEDLFYAEGTAWDHSGKQQSWIKKLAQSSFLITGYYAEPEAVLIRIGGDIRRFTNQELTDIFASHLKWAALILVLYYTLCFSIFAQTIGMWFWGTFLTRKQLAEVLPFRALLYTLLMLFTGILMIPMVIITKRSLADWLCGVRQVGVGSVSKGSTTI